MKTFKTKFRTIFFIFTLSTLFVSCSKDDEPEIFQDQQIPATGSFINAKVDGQPFSSSIFGISTASGSSQGTGAGRLIQIIGADIGSNSIAINLLGVNAIGTYSINPSNDGSVLAYTAPTGSLSYSTGECSGSGGTLVVTYIDNVKIEGTFMFLGKDSDNCPTSATKTVTEGSFRCVFVL